MDAEFLRLLQYLKGITAHIKGPVKGDGHTVRSIDQPFHCFQVQRSIRRQTADDHALGSGASKSADISFHHGNFFPAVQKISETGADEDVNGNPGMAADLFIKGGCGRDSADDESGAKLQPVGSALCGVDCGLYGVHAAFQKIGRHTFFLHLRV